VAHGISKRLAHSKGCRGYEIIDCHTSVLMTMISIDAIREYATKIADRFQPEKIVLFGSQARGTANRYSDVDLLVIMPFEGKGMRKAVEILQSMDSILPVDIIVRQPHEIESRRERSDFFLQEVMNEGVVVYER
jgi:predicted nucleotidyltransferase